MKKSGELNKLILYKNQTGIFDKINFIIITSIFILLMISFISAANYNQGNYDYIKNLKVTTWCGTYTDNPDKVEVVRPGGNDYVSGEVFESGCWKTGEQYYEVKVFCPTEGIKMQTENPLKGTVYYSYFTPGVLLPSLNWYTSKKCTNGCENGKCIGSTGDTGAAIQSTTTSTENLGIPPIETTTSSNQISSSSTQSQCRRPTCDSNYVLKYKRNTLDINGCKIYKCFPRTGLASSKCFSWINPLTWFGKGC